MLTELLTRYMEQAFEQAGYDKAYGKVVLSNRPDLCQFQCNGAMPAAKLYRQAPFMISDQVVAIFQTFEDCQEMVEEIVSVKPGFINIRLTDRFLAQITNDKVKDKRLLVKPSATPKKIIIDYGGPNIAKPLHIGHLRSAIIGETIKRLGRFMGHTVIGDIHMGDWGLQMGMILSEIERQQPDLPYFDTSFEGNYPAEAPFNIDDLEQIYPRVSALAKEDETIRQAAMQATYQLQNGHPGYLALWRHIVSVSLDDLKKNYAKLGVDFDLWNGESDSHAMIPTVINHLTDKDVVEESDGAKIIRIPENYDSTALPPLILVKRDGSYLYGTTDLTTLYQRQTSEQPDQVLYVVDARQALHFKQVFYVAKTFDLVSPSTDLEFIGFGTMNGKDGKPFKTRSGGVLRLSELIRMVETAALDKIHDLDDKQSIAEKVGIAALKFADLSNYRTKDYIFDLDKFISFEGKTGPYLLYSYVRSQNILNKLTADGLTGGPILAASSPTERQLQLKLDELAAVLEQAMADRAPNVLCEYLYDVATLMNSFYHQHHLITETDDQRRASWQSLLGLTLRTLAIGLDILGIPIPDKM